MCAIRQSTCPLHAISSFELDRLIEPFIYFRTSSLSSTSAQQQCNRKSFFNLIFDSKIQDVCYPLNETNQNLSNKENILNSNLDVSNLTSVITKMPPTSTKLPGRQTNNSLSSITGQIVIQAPSTNSSAGPSTSRKKKVKAEV